MALSSAPLSSSDLFSSIEQYSQSLGPAEFSLEGNYRNKNRDVYAAIQSIAKSVVGVCVFTRTKLRFQCSGLLVKMNHKTFILTSARVLRYPERFYSRSHFSIVVRLADGRLVLAEENIVDYHYNILTLVVEPDEELPGFDLKPQESTEEMHVVALGRDFFKGSTITSGGKLELESPDFGCEDLLSTSCCNNEVFEGGPLISEDGDVMGVNFYGDTGGACLLPTSVILTCLNMWRPSRILERPWVGFSVIDSKQLAFEAWEKLKITPTENCTVVKKVFEDSPAGRAGIRPGDTIIYFAGQKIHDAQHYAQMLRDSPLKQKTRIPIVIKRLEDGTAINFEAEAVPASDSRFCYCWPFDSRRWFTKAILDCEFPVDRQPRMPYDYMR